MKNRFCVQTYFTADHFWEDEVAFPTITEAVNYYLNARCEYPNTEFRIITILEVE